MKQCLSLTLVLTCLLASSTMSTGTLALHGTAAIGVRPEVHLGAATPRAHSAAGSNYSRPPWPDAPNVRGAPEAVRSLSQAASDSGSLQGLKGPNFPIADSVDPAGTAETHSSPAVAGNPQDGELMVVWQGYESDTKWNIYSQRLEATGAPAGGVLVVSSGPESQSHPDLAFNPKVGEYLVVWHDHRSGEQWDIYGRRLSTTGTPIGDSFLINGGPSDQGMPRVANDPESGEYLVVWNEYRSSTKWDVRALLIDSRGAALGSVIDIAASTEDQTYPSVAYNSGGREFFIVWEDIANYSTSREDLIGRRIATGGVLIGEDFVITDAPGDQFFPDVAYNATAGEFLVTWEDHGGGASQNSITARRFSMTGVGLGDELALSTGAGIQLAPRVAWSPGADKYLIAWQSKAVGVVAGHTSGRILAADGKPTGTLIPLSADGVGYQSQVVATGDGITGWWLAWQDGRSTTADEIYCQKVTPSGQILQADVRVAATSKGQQQPSISCGDGGQLVFWMDHRNGSDYDIFARRLGADGSPAGESFAVLARDFTQGAPQAVYNPHDGEHIVVVHSLEGIDGFDILALRVRQDGTSIGEPAVLSASTAAGDEGFPCVAYNSQSNEYLVVWHAYTSASWNIYAHRLGANGRLLGDLVRVSESPYAQEFPAAAYNPATDEYVVTWQDKRDSRQYDIYVQRITNVGALLGRSSRVSTVGADDLHPGIAYASPSYGYLLVWQRGGGTAYDIYGRWLSSTGAPSGEELVICDRDGDQLMPTVNAAPLAQDYLVAWEDYNTEDDFSDVYGQRVSAVEGPVGNAFAVTSAQNHQASPALSHSTDSGTLTVVWEDHRNGNWDVYGQQVQLPVPVSYLPLLAR